MELAMIICHCKGISDREIRDAVRAGAQTRREVARGTRASTYCGGCSRAVEAIIADERAIEPVIRLEPVSAYSAAAG